MDEIEHDDFIQRVAVATMAVLREGKQTRQVERISELSGFPAGGIREQLETWGINPYGVYLAYTQFHIERIDAATKLRIPPWMLTTFPGGADVRWEREFKRVRVATSSATCLLR